MQGSVVKRINARRIRLEDVTYQARCMTTDLGDRYDAVRQNGIFNLRC